MSDPTTRQPSTEPDAEIRIRCVELVELVTPYLEGAMSPAEVAAVDVHLAGCHGCETYVEQMRQTVATAGRLEPEHVPAEAVDRLLAAFRASRHVD